jgi:serine/threonine-protein kinase RsbW
MGGSYVISGRATESGLTELHGLIDRVRTNHPDLGLAELAMLETAVIEVAGNVIEHGTPPGGIQYKFILEVTADGLYGSLYDNGDQVVLPPQPDQHDPLAESGRGLVLARAVLTELRYERQGDQNAWFLTRLQPELEARHPPGISDDHP